MIPTEIEALSKQRYIGEMNMGPLNIIVIGLGLAMDAFAVSVTSGLAVRRVRMRYALKLSLSFAFFQALMPVIGWLAGIRFSEKIRTVDHWVAMLLLAAIGIKMILDTIKENANSNCVYSTLSNTGEVSLRTLLALAVATSIDALAVGVSFSCADVDRFSLLLLDAGIIGLITFLLCFPGVYIGCRFGAAFKGKAGIVGGVLLIGMGVKIFVERCMGG